MMIMMMMMITMMMMMMMMMMIIMNIMMMMMMMMMMVSRNSVLPATARPMPSQPISRHFTQLVIAIGGPYLACSSSSICAAVFPVANTMKMCPNFSSYFPFHSSRS